MERRSFIKTTCLCATTGKNLARNRNGGFALPDARGRLLLEINNYFERK